MSDEKYHEILGITPPYGPNDLKSAYRKSAMRTHPNYNKSPEAHDEFLRVQHAYEMLTKGRSSIDILPTNNRPRRSETSTKPKSREQEIFSPAVQKVATMLFAWYEPTVNPKEAYREYQADQSKRGRFKIYKDHPGWMGAIASSTLEPDKQYNLIEHLEKIMNVEHGNTFDMLERRRREFKNWQKDVPPYKKEVGDLLTTKFSTAEFNAALRVCRGELPYHPQG